MRTGLGIRMCVGIKKRKKKHKLNQRYYIESLRNESRLDRSFLNITCHTHHILRHPNRPRRSRHYHFRPSTYQPTCIRTLRSPTSSPTHLSRVSHSSTARYMFTAKATAPTTAAAKAGNSLPTPAFPVCCTGPSLVVEAAEPLPAAPVELEEGVAVTKPAATKLVVCVSSL